MALRDGIKSEEKNTLRDFWMYLGSTSGHGHSDSLNLGIDAFGLNLTPEIGYPRDTGPESNRIQWVSATISHNTVVVDEKTQDKSQSRGNPKHFDDSKIVKLMDADKSAVYPQVETYRRTVLMVKVNEDISYGVDFFRIKGGSDHMFSFHAQSHDIVETKGLSLIPQECGTYADPSVPYGPDPSPLSGVSWVCNSFSYPDGYTWLDHVSKDFCPAPQFMIDFKISDYNLAISNADNLHLRITMLEDESLDEVAIVDGYPVTNAPNPQTNIKYVLARNKADEKGTLFTTVYEPYKSKSYIENIESVDVVRADGEALSKEEIVKAIKVSHKTGRTDYVVYALDNNVEYLVADLFRFRGFAGVASYEREKLINAYLHDGDILTDVICESVAAYTGVVRSFTEALELQNEIEVSFAQLVSDLSELTGKVIFIENDGTENAVYVIKNAKRNLNGNIFLNIGDITLIRSYKDKNDIHRGFIHNIERGQFFRIPRSFVK